MGHPEQPVGGAPPPPAPPVPAPPAGPPPPKERRWLPTIVVLVVLAVVTLGWIPFVLEGTEALPAADPSPPAPSTPPVEVGSGVALLPIPGWEEAERYTDPSGVRLTRGTGNLDAYALDWTGTAEQLLQDFVTQALEAQASQLQVSEPASVAVGGVDGMRIEYVGIFGEQAAAVEGEVTTVVTEDGRGVVFDGWAPQGTLGAYLQEIRVMIEAVQLG